MNGRAGVLVFALLDGGHRYGIKAACICKKLQPAVCRGLNYLLHGVPLFHIALLHALGEGFFTHAFQIAAFCIDHSAGLDNLELLRIDDNIAGICGDLSAPLVAVFGFDLNKLAADDVVQLLRRGKNVCQIFEKLNNISIFFFQNFNFKTGQLGKTKIEDCLSLDARNVEKLHQILFCFLAVF